MLAKHLSDCAGHNRPFGLATRFVNILCIFDDNEHILYEALRLATLKDHLAKLYDNEARNSAYLVRTAYDVSRSMMHIGYNNHLHTCERHSTQESNFFGFT